MGLATCFWIAAVVTNKKKGQAKTEFNGIVDPAKLHLTDNVVEETTGRYAARCLNLSEEDLRHPVVYTSHTELWTAFWGFYMTHRHNCDIINDCRFFAVENLFTTCANTYPGARKFQCPPRLFNIATMLEIRGQNSDLDREEFLAKHNCSLVPNNWHQKSDDPFAGALATLSMYFFLANQYNCIFPPAENEK